VPAHRRPAVSVVQGLTRAALCRSHAASIHGEGQGRPHVRITIHEIGGNAQGKDVGGKLFAAASIEQHGSRAYQHLARCRLLGRFDVGTRAPGIASPLRAPPPPSDATNAPPCQGASMTQHALKRQI